MVICAIVGCSATYRQDDKSVNLYGLPSVIQNQCDETRDLSTRRRVTWLSRINRPELFNSTQTRDVKVCKKHFITGKPAQLFQKTNPDWAPTLHLGYPRKESEREFIDRSIARAHRADVRRERNRESTSSPSVKRRRPNDNQNICVPGVQNNECVMPLLNIDTNIAEKTLQEETSDKLEAGV